LRIFLHLLLGALALGALVHGLRKIWRSSHPSQSETEGFEQAANDLEYTEEKTFMEEVSHWMGSRQGRSIILLLGLLFFIMTMDRILSLGDKTPVDYQPAPSADTVKG
jgi:hypothetical protein